MGKHILAKDWEILPNGQKENGLHLAELLDRFRQEDGLKLEFDQGEYHFFPDYAAEKMLYISNHDEDTIKRVAFDLTGYKNLKIVGNGAEFIFHTDIIPFYCHECENVTIENIHIDYERPAYSEGRVLSVSPNKIRIWIDKEKYPFYTAHKRLYFTGENYCHELTYWMEIDPERYAPVCREPDLFFNWQDGGTSAYFKEAEEGVVEMTLEGEEAHFSEASAPGNLLVLRHHPRTHPAFYVTDSKDIRCFGVTVYHCEGMAFISQFTENVSLEQFRVIRHPEKKRAFSAAADALHFVYCRGLIQIKDCLLENQLDDCLNVHGIYFRIDKVISDNEVIAELVHPQQKGVRLGDKGDTLAAIDYKTMLKYGEAALEEVKALNKDYCYVRFDRAIENLRKMDVLENKSWTPDVLVEGCTFRNNRARGLLLTSAGNVTVRKNHFHVPGAAILMEGDSKDWFESGETRNIWIEENLFDNCDYVENWGRAPIQVSPSAKLVTEAEKFHKNLEIRNNKFICFDQRILYARNIERIVFEGNTVIRSDRFPAREGKVFDLENVTVFQKKD